MRQVFNYLISKIHRIVKVNVIVWVWYSTNLLCSSLNGFFYFIFLPHAFASSLSLRRWNSYEWVRSRVYRLIQEVSLQTILRYAIKNAIFSNLRSQQSLVEESFKCFGFSYASELSLILENSNAKRRNLSFPPRLSKTICLSGCFFW